jgi:uridine kinase
MTLQRIQGIRYSLIIRLKETQSLYGANVIIFEGIFSLYDEKVRDLLDLKVFVACDDDIRLTRRCNFCL